MKGSEIGGACGALLAAGPKPESRSRLDPRAQAKSSEPAGGDVSQRSTT
jgi:hypothetical protein